MRFLLSVLFLGCAAALQAQAPKQYSAADVYQDVASLSQFGSVLYIAAHPDDENTRLLGYLANERHLRTGLPEHDEGRWRSEPDRR